MLVTDTKVLNLSPTFKSSLSHQHHCELNCIKLQRSKMFLVDDIGSCERVSCECDLAFVSDLSRVYFHQDHSNGQIKNTGMILNFFYQR